VNVTKTWPATIAAQKSKLNIGIPLIALSQESMMKK